jgi:hypothetical protein
MREHGVLEQSEMTPQAISDFRAEPPRRDVPTSLAGRGKDGVAARET